MRGLLRPSLRCLASYRDAKRLTDAYRLLITKKPVEYDYVAIDVDAFFGGAQSITKNVTSEQRKNKEVARHVLNALQQLLRRVVCRHALLLAFDGAGTAAKAHHFRTGKLTRRMENRLTRLPGAPLARAVEERIVKAMPLTRGLIPREVVISGGNVEGCVERKVAAWALDLACRDGTQQHTTRSICVIGSSSLWYTMLALTPYFQATHILSGAADLRHTTLGDALTWLELSTQAESGDTHAVTTGRTDALLLMLLCMGCDSTELPALPGANFTVVMDAYHRRRARTQGDDAALSTNDSAASTAVASAAPASSSDASTSVSAAPFQLLYELPNGVVEVDLLALYALFLPERDVAAKVAELTDNAASPFARPASPPSASSLRDSQTLVGASAPPTAAQLKYFGSFLTHLLSTFYLLSYGETTVDATQLPFYQSCSFHTTTTTTTKDRTSERSGGVAGEEGKQSASDNSTKEADDLFSLAGWVRFLRLSIISGRRYHTVNTSAATAPTITQVSPADAASLSTDAPAAITTASSSSSSSTATLMTTAHFPFWTQNQPWTAAEYTVLCNVNPTNVETLLREYVPGVAHKVSVSFLRGLASSRWSLDTTRFYLQRLFAHASVEAPHPSLCFGPSYCWTHNDKSRMWTMRYVDLGVQARAADVRHTRSLLSGTQMTQQKSEEGAVAYDALAKAWVVQPTFPLLANTSGSARAKRADAPAASGGDAPTLKVLTWNVMFDRYSGQPTPLGMPGIDWCSPQRYPVLAKIIAEEDADVVGMQEVEAAFADYLAAQPWCRERYIMSCSPRSSLLDPWGVLVLVRRGEEAWPVQQLTHLNVPAWSGHVSLMPVVTLDLSGGKESRRHGSNTRQHSALLVNVCSMHLLAPYLKAHETARTGQDQALRQCLVRQVHGDTIVMGDFNDWPSNEFSMPAETRYVECWPLVRPDDYGKTMDESNTFCKMKIEEIFFGRSDKLFLRTGNTATGLPPLLKPVEAHLVGTRSVNEENANQDAPAYLFPSDHYGVSMTFRVL